VREDLLDGDLVVEVGHGLELAPALATRERVGLRAAVRTFSRQKTGYCLKEHPQEIDYHIVN